MAAAHDYGKVNFEENLLKGMKHKCANHAMKMWVQLLWQLNSPHESSGRCEETEDHLAQILNAIKEDVMNLVCDVHGVRTVNGVLEIAQEEFQKKRTYRYIQVEEIVARLSSTDEKDGRDRILYNIKHDFANHTIQQVLD